MPAHSEKAEFGPLPGGSPPDVLERKLPNDMAFWLPNEQFLTRSGHTFDGTGIPPHLRTPVFTPEEFAKNRDSAFDTAVAALRR